MILETSRLYLRYFKDSDALRMSEYRSKKEVAQYQSWNSYGLLRSKLRIKQLSKLTALNKVNSDYHLAIILKENDLLIGDLFINIVNDHTFVIGYTLDSLYWSKGYGSEIVDAYIRYMHQTYHFTKVMAYAYSDNKRSRRLLEKLGFQLFQESSYYDDVGYIKRLSD